MGFFDFFSKPKQSKRVRRSVSQEVLPINQRYETQDIARTWQESGGVSGPPLAECPRRPQTAISPQESINVILFGETGVGKSAVVNLIAQREVAEVSPDAKPCTLQSTRYNVSFDGLYFSIFDTAGLNGPSLLEHDAHLAAIASAYNLIRELRDAGGIHLLLCCMPGSRLKAGTLNNYTLFSKVLCQTNVPVAVVVTGLEREENMDGWWVRNEAGIEQHGIKCMDHACITTVADVAGKQLKYTESQHKIRELLKRSARKTGGYLLDTTTWLGAAGAGMRDLTKEGKTPTNPEIKEILLGSLDLSEDQADKVIGMMEGNGKNTK